MNTSILVIGSTGKNGKSVFEKLQARNCEIVLSKRNSQIPFDCYNQGGWMKALRNIDKVYITLDSNKNMYRAQYMVFSFDQL